MSREDAAALEDVMERIGARFGRVEPRRRALAYLHGLLSPIERKNGWQLAETAGDRTPDGVQDFLARVGWDADRVGDDLRAPLSSNTWTMLRRCCARRDRLCEEGQQVVRRAAPILGDRRAYRPFDFAQDCQIGVFLGDASGYGQTLIDRALDLPKRWATGTTVTWKNEDDEVHRVADDHKAFSSAALDTDDSFSHTFATAGVYHYFCTIHPYMVGKIVIKPPSPKS